MAQKEIDSWIKEEIDFTDVFYRLKPAFVKRRILLRAITDYIAGMTDGFVLEQYKLLF